jgi:hypothetical protein
MVTSSSNWLELQRYVSSLREAHPEREIWTNIHDPTQEELDEYKKQGWRVWPKKGVWALAGALDGEKKRLYYAEDLDYKRRDITICHELAHLYYPKQDYQQRFGYDDWECIIDWIGRSWRRKHPVLRRIFETFHVPPRIYDSVTRQAFPERTRPRRVYESLGEQLLLPFTQQIF